MRDPGYPVMPVEQTKSGKQMEKLDRGLVAVRVNNGVYLSWRLFGNDPVDTAFNLYRNGAKINNSPLTGATNFTDTGGNTSATYSVRAITNGVEAPAGKTVAVWQNQYKSIPVSPPPVTPIPSGEAYTYAPGDASVADLDGDGDYEIILKWDPSNAKDSSQFGYTGKVYIDAYTLEGQQLWRVDLGPNIRAGAHDTQFMVYDFDGDGKAELAVRTSDGARDSAGTLIGQDGMDYYVSGHIGTGPEYLTMFDGLTGRVLANTTYPNTRGNLADWGGNNLGRQLNRSNRFLAGVAYVNGETPSMIWARGYYDYAGVGQTKIAAVDWQDGQFITRWEFLAKIPGGPNPEYVTQGAHSLTIGDVDGDGRDEIVYGAATIDDDGTGLYSTQLCHGDALHMTDIDLSNPGLEVFMVHESEACYGNHGVEVHDGATGRILYSAQVSGDIGRGVAADVNPNYPGVEVFGSRGGTIAAGGQQISDDRPGSNFAIWWDGDLLRELLSGSTIDKWDYNGRRNNRVYDAYAAFNGVSNNGTKATPSIQADILGDWREEVIWRHETRPELYIVTTTTETSHRIYTLMHDAQYRVAVAWQNTAYNQPPHPGFFLGADMQEPPVPAMYYPGEQEPETNEPILEVQENAAGYCSVAGIFENTNGGFTGTGYLNTDNAQGTNIVWAVDAPAAGSYQVTLRYTATSARPGSLSINGAGNQNIGFENTNSWTAWRNLTTTVNLQAGNNVLNLTATGAEGLPNIDKLTVWHTGVIAGNCP